MTVRTWFGYLPDKMQVHFPYPRTYLHLSVRDTNIVTQDTTNQVVFLVAKTQCFLVFHEMFLSRLTGCNAMCILPEAFNVSGSLTYPACADRVVCWADIKFYGDGSMEQWGQYIKIG
jgi:hypothetical protein